MTTTHTPGPWEYDGDYIFAAAIGGYIADPNTDDMTSGRYVAKRDAQVQIEANARLIAAAPDLLAALQGVLRVADRATDEFDAARAAIARATGSAA